MQSEEYINGSTEFREANIRKNSIRATTMDETSKETIADERTVLNYAAESSLNLKDVSNFYSPWDERSRQLQLQLLPLHELEVAWNQAFADFKNENRKNDSASASRHDENRFDLPHSHAEDNIIFYINELLDSTKNLPEIRLSNLEELINHVIRKQTGSVECRSLFAVFSTIIILSCRH